MNNKNADSDDVDCRINDDTDDNDYVIDSVNESTDHEHDGTDDVSMLHDCARELARLADTNRRVQDLMLQLFDLMDEEDDDSGDSDEDDDDDVICIDGQNDLKTFDTRNFFNFERYIQWIKRLIFWSIFLNKSDSFTLIMDENYLTHSFPIPFYI